MPAENIQSLPIEERARLATLELERMEPLKQRDEREGMLGVVLERYDLISDEGIDAMIRISESIESGIKKKIDEVKKCREIQDGKIMEIAIKRGRFDVAIKLLFEKYVKKK